MRERKLVEVHQRQPSPSFLEQNADSWDFHYQKLIQSLEGTQQQKEAIIRKRILRYFGQFKLDEQTYFSMRSNIDYNIPNLRVLTDKLVLYGVDYMSIQKAKNYFSGFITQIRRVDDSHFLVQFRNQGQCLGAINLYQKKKQRFFNPQQMFTNSIQGWIEMKPYKQFIFQRKLMARYATTLDKTQNFISSAKQSCTLAYSEAKRRFLKSLKEDFQQKDRIRYQKFHSQKNHQNLRVRQRLSSSRSRQKNILDKKNNCQNFYGRCCHNCHGIRQRSLNRDRSRSTSRQSLTQYPRRIMEQKIKQSDFKFEMYIKKRNNERNKKNQNMHQINLEILNPEIRALNNINKTCQIQYKNQRTNSTSHEDIDIEIIESGSNPKFNNNMVDLSQTDFEKYLEKLKLEDSKNQYSAFDIEMDP